MKRKILILLACSLLATSCHEMEYDSTFIEEHVIPLFHYEGSSFEKEDKIEYMPLEITLKNYHSLLNQKASFPLFVYGEGCGKCDLFSLTLKEYIHNEKVSLPFMTLAEYTKAENHISISDSSFLFFHQGQLMTYKTDFDDIPTEKELKEYLNKYTYDTNIQILNASYIAKCYDDTFTTYHFRNGIDKQEDKDFSYSGFQGEYLQVINTCQLDYPEFYSYLKEQSVNNIVFGNIDKDETEVDLVEENLIGIYVIE